MKRVSFPMQFFCRNGENMRKNCPTSDNPPCGSRSNFLYRSSSTIALMGVRMGVNLTPRPSRLSLSLLGSIAAATLCSLTLQEASAQTATGTGAVSDGVGSSANGRGSVAIGNDNSAVGDGSVANGDSNTANGEGTVAEGSNNRAEGDGAIAIGKNNIANGNGALALGSGAVANGDSSIAFGVEAGAGSATTNFESVAIGYAAGQNVVGNQNVAIGSGAGQNVLQDNTTSIGASATAAGARSVAIGYGANVIDNGGTDGLAIGSFAVASGSLAGAIGPGATSSGNGSYAIGYLANAISDNGIAIGVSSNVSGQSALALGMNAAAAGGSAVSIGTDSEASGESSTAVGRLTEASGNYSLAGGYNAVASSDFSTALGFFSEASGTQTVSIGARSKVSGDDSGAIGNNNIVVNLNSFVLGNNITTTQDNSVVLGNASADRAATSVSSVGQGGITFGAFAGAGSVANGVVSVGAIGMERQLIHVAAGEISATSTDAVNGSQLYATNNVLGKLAASTVSHLGGGSTVNADGSLSAPDYSVGGTTYHNVGSALAAQNSIVSQQGSSIANALGGTSSYNAATGTVTAGFNVGGTSYTDVNTALNAVSSAVATVADNAVQYDDASHGSVTLGGAGASAPVGLHNVAAGGVTATSTDAVNGAQLYATNQQVSQNAADIDSLTQNITNGTIGLVQQAGGAPGNGQITIGAVTGGTSVSIAGTNGNRVLSGVAAGVAADDAVNVAQLEAAIANVSMASNAVQYDNAGRTSVTLNAGSNAATLRNVAAGDVNATSTDAINGSQLYATNQQVATNSTQIAQLETGQAGPFRANNTSGYSAPNAAGADAVAGGFGAVASGDKATAIGTNASATGGNSVALGYGSSDNGRANVVSVGTVGAERQITNVAAGVLSTDAVNVGQLNNGLAGALSAANRYTDSRLEALHFDLASARRDADAGTASAMAVAGLPQAFSPGGGTIAGSFGVYRNETAFALGASKVFTDGQTVVKGGMTVSTRSGTFGGNVGIGYQF